MSQVSSDFDEPLLDDDDLVVDSGGFGESDFGDSSFGDGLDAQGLGDEQGWDDVDATAGVASKQAAVKKQGFSIYTVMLIMSFVFLTVAAILIFMELGRLKQ